MKNKTPLELLRAAIEEQRCEIQCDTLHELHGDDYRDCGDRSCDKCKVDALRKAADLVEAELDALKARALPEGCEWPTVDGIPVSFEERLVGYGSDSKGYEVVGVRPSCNWVLVKAAGGDILEWDASNCTRPILAADGEPLEVGQTVWDVESGIEYEVVGIHTDEDSPVRVMRTDGSHLAKAAKPSTLTHERPVPDTWERLEEDAKKGSCDYFGCDANGCNGCPAYDWNTALGGSGCGNAMRADLMRRAKKLAGVTE